MTIKLEPYTSGRLRVHAAATRDSLRWAIQEYSRTNNPDLLDTVDDMREELLVREEEWKALNAVQASHR